MGYGLVGYGHGAKAPMRSLRFEVALLCKALSSSYYNCPYPRGTTCRPHTSYPFLRRPWHFCNFFFFGFGGGAFLVPAFELFLEGGA